jgi:hypothetical protein
MKQKHIFENKTGRDGSPSRPTKISRLVRPPSCRDPGHSEPAAPELRRRRVIDPIFTVSNFPFSNVRLPRRSLGEGGHLIRLLEALDQEIIEVR